MQASRTRWLPWLTLGAVLANAAGAQSPSETVEALKSCARTTDREARIGCYERLGERVLRDETVRAAAQPQVASDPVADAAATAGAAVDDEAPPLPDDIGGVDFEDPATAQKEQYVGRITDCKRGPDSRWIFYFENGQIWKQADYRRARFRDCDAMATIFRDRIGYRLQIEGNDRTVRVSRRQ